MLTSLFQYMFAALQDCCRPLIAAKHLADNLTLLEQFNNEMTTDFHQVMLGKLSSRVINQAKFRLIFIAFIKLGDLWILECLFGP